MKLNGTLSLSVPPEVAAEGFQDPKTLGIFLPKNSQLTRAGPGEFSFVVIKEAGIVALKLPGTLTVTPSGAGYLFEARAKHLIGGSATLSLALTFVPGGDGCEMTYDGTLESTGLAGRMLRERADHTQSVLDARFAAVKAEIESFYRSYAV